MGNYVEKHPVPPLKCKSNEEVSQWEITSPCLETGELHP